MVANRADQAPMGTGRDAADVVFATIFGPVRMTYMGPLIGPASQRCLIRRGRYETEIFPARDRLEGSLAAGKVSSILLSRSDSGRAAFHERVPAVR